MSNKSRLAFTIVQAFCAIVTFFAVVTTLYSVGPALETRFWPVVSKLQVLSLTPTSDGEKTVLRVAFKKRRDCEYIGLAWFVGDRGKEFDRIAVELRRDGNDTSSPNRPLGYQRAGPWVLSIPAGEVRSRSFAQLFHRCHPFWVTTTDFYP